MGTGCSMSRPRPDERSPKPWPAPRPLGPVEAAGLASPSLPGLIRLPKLIVLGSLGRISEDFVRLVDLLKAFFGLMIARVLVGMIFHRELAVGLLDFFLFGVPGDTEQFVVVLIFHRTPAGSL